MERKNILIATKTYPSISIKYKETVCTAGVLLDDNEKPRQWIRIYPIRFRDLNSSQRYKRWSIISAKIQKNDKDYREESYKINDSSIEVIKQIGTNNNWEERKNLILPLQFQSVAEIQKSGKSLGLIKPKSIEGFFYKPDDREWKPRQQAILDQGDLFEPSVEIEKIPYKFGYHFTQSEGTKHSYTIIDWEVLQLYRNCKNNSKSVTEEQTEQEAVEKVRQKLEDDFLKKKEIYFIVGNLKNHCNTFMIIGIFYPPKTDTIQMKLFNT